MTQKHIADFDEILKNSEFLMSLRQLNKGKKSVLLGDSCRSLTDKEAAALKAQGNRSDDWNQIRVANEFRTEHIFDSVFSGKCILGVFQGEGKMVGKSVECPSGIYKSNVMNSEIGNNCLISGAALLSNYIVKENAVIYQTEAMVCSGESAFGNGIDIAVGPETGGRNILSFAEITIPIAEAVTTRRSDFSLQKAYKEFIHRYTKQARIPFGIVEEGSLIWNTKKIEDVFVGRGVVIDGAVLVKNCTLLGTEAENTEISHGAVIRDTCVQWGSTITTGAIVEKSIIAEQARIERHSVVTHSIVGPNAAIGEGEITSSLVGPFIASHHQSLLIAAVWPGGKGNVGYGANVGSNHTSRAPDQEIHCGEGMFFGLGVNIKFPADFSKAPYTIIAAGVNTLPQRMEFPFSLINTRSGHFPEIHPAYNELIPGWVLTNNIYMVKRSEDKFKERDLARRTQYPSEIFRADIIDKMIHARNLLDGVNKNQVYYTDEQIPEIGKNFLTEENRKKGVEAYELYVEYYVLKGLMKEVENWIREKRIKDLASFYDLKTNDAVWKHQRKILFSEGFDKRSCQENLKRLIIIQNRIAADTKKCKEKDDNRGLTIIPDYKKVATPASGDPIVMGVQDETKKLQRDISSLLNKVPK